MPVLEARRSINSLHNANFKCCRSSIRYKSVLCCIIEGMELYLLNNDNFLVF